MNLRLAGFILMIISGACQGQKIDSLLEVISRNTRDIEQVRAMNNVAAEYMRNNVEKGRAYLFSTIAMSKTLQLPQFESAAYAQLVSFHTNNAAPDSAGYYLDLLRNLSTQAKGTESDYAKMNYYSAAGLFFKRTGNLPVAADFMKKAINAAGKTANPSNLAGQLMNLGNTYNLMGDYKNAISNHLKALRLFEEDNNAKGQSFCYQNISNSFIELKQFANALQYAKQSLAIKEKLNDVRGLGTTHNALGQIYQGLNKHDQALTHYTSSLETARKFNLAAEQAKLHYNIAKLQLLTGDTTTAQEHLNQGKEFAQQLNDSSLISSIEMLTLAIKRKRQEAAHAERTMLAGIKTLQENAQLSKEATSYEHIAEFYVANQQFEKALEYTKKYYQYKDSLTSNELLGQIKAIEEQYNLDKKEKEIAILKKDQLLQQARLEKQQLYQVAGIIVIILIMAIALVALSRYRLSHKARELLQMEKLRNDIARDLHDDIGSTLTSINILSKVMLQKTVDASSDMKANLQKIKDHSSTIMESMSDIVWAINPRNDTVEKVIIKMKEFAAEVLDPLQIGYQFEEVGDFSDVKLTLHKRKDLFLIFKEAINNAAKYSECSFINIALKHEHQTILLQVKDNGRGFDQENVRSGNGLQNMMARAQQMLAALKFHTAIGSGTDMQLSVPSHD